MQDVGCQVGTRGCLLNDSAQCGLMKRSALELVLEKHEHICGNCASDSELPYALIPGTAKLNQPILFESSL